MTFSTPRRSLCAALAACAFVLAGACTPGAPSTGPAPEASTRLEPRDWTAQSSAAEIAAWARQGCRRAPGGRTGCIERTLVSLLEQTGVSKSMEVLDTLAAVDEELRGEAHPLAHGLGISAYSGPETVAATFAACPVSQMSGCYHGVIQGYFLDLSARGQTIDAAVLDALCEPHRASRFVHFQCGHGMGHGLMAVHENHLPSALEACSLVSDAFMRESCYGGAFMENVVHVTHPHHTAGGHTQTQGGPHAQADEHASGAHAEAGGHAGHGGGGGHGMAHAEWKPLDRADPQYPCNALDAKYGDACYGMQTSAVMFFTGGDVAATARACEDAPQAFLIRCFMSLGRDVSSWAGQDPARSAEMCRRTGPTAQGRGGMWCTRGLVETLMNQSADPQVGIRFCRLTEGAETRTDCYATVGGFIQSLIAGTDARAQQCASAEPEFVDACRRAAGLQAQRSGSE